MDFEVALERVEGDLQFLAELAAIFLDDYPRFLASAREAVEKGDGPALEREAHSFRGRLAFFDIDSVHGQALELEMMGRRRDLSGAVQALSEIESAMKNVLPELKALAGERRP